MRTEQQRKASTPAESQNGGRRADLRVPSALSYVHNWIALLLIAAPMLLGCIYVAIYGINIAWEDQFFSLTPIFEKWYAGNLHLGDFWAQHNEHRHFLPRLVMFAAGLVDSWDTKVEMWLVQALLAVNLTLLLAASFRACHGRWRYWLAVPLAWLVFSLRQYQNLLCGFQLSFVMAATAALATFSLLASLQNGRRPWWKFSAALLTATVGTASSAHGLLIWLVGLLPLAIHTVKRDCPIFAGTKIGTIPWRRAAFAAGWIAAALVEGAAYFAGYHETVHPLSPVQERSLANCAEYFVTVVGGALFPSPLAAKWGGLALLAIAAIGVAAVVRRRKLPQSAFWLAVTAFGLLTQAEVAWGRTPFGNGQALSSRYATFSLFVVVGVYGILALGLADRPNRSIAGVWAVLLVLIAWGIGLSTLEGFQAGAELKQRMDYHRFVFLTAGSQPDGALRFAPWEQPEEIRHNLAVLKEHRLNVFAPAERPDRYESPSAALPTVAAALRIEVTSLGFSLANHDLVLAGYAVAPGGKQRVGGVAVEIDDKPYTAYYGLPVAALPDVPRDPGLRECGFRREFSQQQLPAGTHHLAIKAWSEDRGTWFAAARAQQFEVPDWPK